MKNWITVFLAKMGAAPKRWGAFVAAVGAVIGAMFGVAHVTKAPLHFASLGGGPTTLCPLGWFQPDPNTSQCSTAFGWQPSVADATTTVMSVQGLTPNDDDFVTVLVKVQVPGATDETGRAWFRYKWGFTYRADASAFADPTGATTPTAVDSQIGSGLTGTVVNLVQSGSNLIATVNCATASSCASSGSVDWFRNAPSPWVLGVSPSVLFTAPTGPSLVTITTTPGGTNGLLGSGCIVAGAYAGTVGTTVCPSGSMPLTGCVQVDPQTATCFLPAGTYTAGVDSVCLASSAHPFCLVGGMTLDASVPDATDAADAADATDSADSGSDAADAADAADSSDSGGDAGPAPTITACTAGSSTISCFGSAAGQTIGTGSGQLLAAAAPTITGTGLTSCTSISFNGTAISSGNFTCTGGTSCAITGSWGAVTEGAGTNVTVTCAGGTSAAYGNGALQGFQSLHASYHLYFANWDVAGDGGTDGGVYQWTDLGDAVSNECTQTTSSHQMVQANVNLINGLPGLFINGAGAAQSYCSLSSLASQTAGHMIAAYQGVSPGYTAYVWEFGSTASGSYVPNTSATYDDWGATGRIANGVPISAVDAKAPIVGEVDIAASGEWTDWYNGHVQWQQDSGATVGFSTAPYIGATAGTTPTAVLSAYGDWLETLPPASGANLRAWLCPQYGVTCI